MLSAKNEVNLSKFMSYLLRHKPQEHGLVLDSSGFCKIKDLLNVINRESKWKNISQQEIEYVVCNCPKQRYLIENDSIRANYGHSETKLNYSEGTPPEILFHGTNENAVDKILTEGLKSMNRKYVHLSEGTDFATLAGQRRGKLVILKIDTRAAMEAGVKFYFAENEVWLTENIPACFIKKGK